MYDSHEDEQRPCSGSLLASRSMLGAIVAQAPTTDDNTITTVVVGTTRISKNNHNIANVHQRTAENLEHG